MRYAGWDGAPTHVLRTANCVKTVVNDCQSSINKYKYTNIANSQ